MFVRGTWYGVCGSFKSLWTCSLIKFRYAKEMKRADIRAGSLTSFQTFAGCGPLW